MTPATSTNPTTTQSEPTHGCARCGAPVGVDVGLCERCNPLGLRDVAASQVHGTVIIAVLVGIIALGIGASLAIRGAGPYPATLDTVVPTEAGIVLTLTVTNEGSSEGQTTCRVHDPADQGGGPSAHVLTPRIAAGESRTFQSTIVEFGSTIRGFVVECRTP